MIMKEGKTWVLYSHQGKKLGSFKSYAEAIKREREVVYFKNKGKKK